MNIKNYTEVISNKINVLNSFKEDILDWFYGNYDSSTVDELRSQINRSVKIVRDILLETECLSTITIAPPPAIGGLMIRNYDPFNNVLQNYYGRSFIPDIRDMIDQSIGVLESPEYIEKMLEYETYKTKALNQKTANINALQLVLQICKRFHLVAIQLQYNRYSNRDTITINDEYDVQDLLAGLLKVNFDDVRNEEWTPSYAGKSSRVDFLLKREKIIIEVKKTRKPLGVKEVGDQLIIDIDRYKIHPDCNTLICFVYDPGFLIGNPSEIEVDLSGRHNNLDVHVIVAPDIR